LREENEEETARRLPRLRQRSLANREIGLYSYRATSGNFGPNVVKRSRSVTTAAVALSLAFVAHVGATASYDYKPGQFLVIDGGTSPDKKFSVVSGENKAGEFGVYLRDARTKKLIGQLEEVATDLDSAPDAYRAHWAPDSKHIGVSSRADRHLTRNVIYRIENGRAYVVETPQLICHAVAEFCALQKEL